KRTGLLITLGAGLVLLVVLAFTVGPILYRDLIVGPAASTPQEELSAQAGPGAGGDLELGAGEWVLGEGSFAGYRVAEVLNGTDVTVTGRTESVSGRVTTSDTAVTAATIEVDVASIATDSSSRDSYFREQALDTATHPTASFVLDGTIAPDPVPGPGETIDLPVAGSLTLNGVTREITAELTTALTDAGVTVAGQIPVTFADYGVTAPDLGFVRVDDQGFIEFSLTLVRAAG
ncbi:YceI family protein, partial [Leucobacter sp. M11]|uniref:YceI family protein n=1 Tax=Leucobacter sp. M11 TaxID=2993565 RepID=UPI002D806E7D